MSVRTTNPVQRVAVILLLIILLPALFFSAYEVNSLSNSESLLERIYRQQIDVILYSLNQYSWDVVSNWASTIVITLREHHESSETSAEFLRSFMANAASVRAVILMDSTLSDLRIEERSGDSALPARFPAWLNAAVREGREKIDRLPHFQRLEYRKIEPLVLQDSSGKSSMILLVFAAGLPAEGIAFAGIVLDEELFVRDVLASKLREAAGDEFVVAVFSERSGATVFATEQVDPSAVRQKKLLWLFPEYTVGILLKGDTVEDILRGRFYRSLGLIALLDVVLIAGVWFVYRSFSREMQLVRMKSGFISNVSHELRTPLALIRMFAETLEMGRIHDEAKKQEYYSTILGETERLTRLVNNILSFSRMEAGKRRFRFAQVDVNALVRGVLKTYAFKLQQEGFMQSLELEERLPAIQGDEEAIAEAFINILDNAVKYSNTQKYLRVATRADAQHLVLEVEDHGIGIPAEHRARIFETFYRVSDGLVHDTKGTGLGLAMVKQIMEAHEGAVTVESSVGNGSIFRLLFPLTRES